MGQHAVIGFLVLRLGNPYHRSPYRAIIIKGFLVEIVKEGAQSVEIMLRGRIKLVVVADRTSDGKTHECGAISFRALTRDIDAQFLGDRTALVAADAQSYVAAADQRIKVLHRQQIARNLLARKLVKRLVGVE